MQSSAVLSCQGDAFSRAEKCDREPRTSAEFSKKIAVPAIESPAGLDSRTRMLLEQPIAPMILRLAIPNATVMTVQILIGLVEVYFVSRTGVDGLAGVAPVFPLVSLVVAVAQGAIGGGIVTAVARALGAGRIGAASEYAWYALALGVPLGLATTAAMHALGPTLYAQMGISGNALEIAVSYSSTIFAGAVVIWLFNLLMAVVRGTGNLQVPVIVVCGGALILVPLSPALIFGVFGYDGLGPSGGAVATRRACPARARQSKVSDRPILVTRENHVSQAARC